MQKRNIHLSLLAATIAVSLLVLAAPSTAFAQASLFFRAKAGVASANIDDTGRAGDPIFNVGGGAQGAAMLRFKGGLAGGFNFNYNYDSHVTSGYPQAERPSMAFSQPSFGIIVLFEFMPSVNLGGWANYIFGSAEVDAGSQKSEFDLQGFELGAEATLNYQLKPYKTYILAGAFAYFQYMNMFVASRNDLGFSDMPAENYGIGASLGMRFDFSF